MVAIGHLDQAKLWPEGVFAHEFGIDGDEIAVPDEVAEFDQCGVGFDQRMDLHSAPIQLVDRNGQEKLPMLVGSRSRQAGSRTRGSEERRGGEEWVSTCRSRWGRYCQKKKGNK